MAQPKRSSASSMLMVVLMVAGTLVATALVLNYLSHRSQKANATVSISGAVECTDGSSVVGVQLVPTDGQAKSAMLQLPDTSTASKATFTYGSLRPDSRFKLFVGCGGSPNSWATQNWGPEVDTTSNRTYACDPKLKDPNRQTCRIG